MNRIILIAILAGSALALVILGAVVATTSVDFGRIRGSGRVTVETRELEPVTGVNLATIGRLDIETGDELSLRIEAEDNILRHLTTEVQNGKLRIDTERGVNLRPQRPIRYHLSVPSLNEIEVSSNGDVDAGDLQAESFTIRVRSNGDLIVDSLETGDLDVRISSSGDVTIDELSADSIYVDISSSGDLTISEGEVDSQKINIVSSGSYDAPELESNEAQATLSSNGSATISVRDHLRATLSSNGDLRYHGDPETFLTTSSSGKAVKLDD